MMRWSVLLLLIPVAAAQTAPPAGDLAFLDVYSHEVYPHEQGHLAIEVEYACGDLDGLDGPLEIHVAANATTRAGGIDVPIDEPGTRIVEVEDCFRQIQGRTIDFPVELQWTHGGFSEPDILDVRYEVWGVMGTGDAERTIPAVEGKTSVPMRVPPADEPIMEVHEAEQSSTVDDVQVPGAPIALLAAGLLALARRR